MNSHPYNMKETLCNYLPCLYSFSLDDFIITSITIHKNFYQSWNDCNYNVLNVIPRPHYKTLEATLCVPIAQYTRELSNLHGGGKLIEKKDLGGRNRLYELLDYLKESEKVRINTVNFIGSKEQFIGYGINNNKTTVKTKWYDIVELSIDVYKE